MADTIINDDQDNYDEGKVSPEDRKKEKVREFVMRRIKAGRKFWEPHHKEWKVLRDFHMVNRSKDTDVTDNRVENKKVFQIAYSFSTVETAESSVFDQDPTWVARPRLGAHWNEDYAKTIKAVPKALDYIWDDNELTERVEGALHTFTGYGIGGLKIAMRDTTKRVPRLKKAIKFAGIPILPERQVVETIGKPSAELAYSVINPLRFFVAPESKSLDRWDDIPWCFEWHTEEIDVARSMLGSEEVAPTGKRAVGEQVYDSTEEQGMERDKVDYAQDTVDFYEYYGYLPASIIGKENADYRYHVILTEKKAYTCEPIYHNDGEPPYEIAWDYVGLPTDNLGMVIPFGEIKPIYHLEEEMSETRAAMVVHRKRSSRAKIILPTGAEVDEDQLKSAEQDAIVRTDDPQAVRYLEPSPFDDTLVAHANMTRQDISVVSGQDDLNRGASTDQTVQTATGQRLLEAARSRRAKRKYRKISKLIERIGVKTLNRLAQYKPEIWYEQDDQTPGSINLQSLVNPETGLINMVIKVKTGSQSSVEREILREQTLQLYKDTIKDDQSIAPESKQEILRRIWRDFDIDEADRIVFMAPQVPVNPAVPAEGGNATPTETPLAPTTAATEPALPAVPGMDQSGNVVEEGM